MGAILSWANEGRSKRSRQMAIERFRLSMASMKTTHSPKVGVGDPESCCKRELNLWNDVPRNDK